MKFCGICLILGTALYSSPVVEEVEAPIAVHEELMKMHSRDGYTINYNTLSIAEYIRFASKICGVNFIFNEDDLNFNVTVVSDGPMSPDTVMATLVQVLRIHGLMLLEQDNNLVVHKNGDVKQVANLVVDSGSAHHSPIVTRLFRIKIVKPEAVASIVRPLISKEAILDVSAETKQLILTDVTANVDKIALLIENLDTPYANVETKTYEARHNGAEFLIGMAQKIMEPVLHGNPFVMVPQPFSHTIYIVSTPELNAKAIAVLKRLDTPPKKGGAMRQGFKADNVYVYKIEHAAGENVIQGLRDIASSLKQAGVLDFDLIDSLNHAKLVHETNSILFVASKESIEKIKEFLPALDGPIKEKRSFADSFFLFSPQHRTPKEVQTAIHEMAKNLKGTKGVSPALIDTMESARVNPLTSTLFFSGEEQTFGRVKELLITIDSPSGSSFKKGQDQFFIYAPHHQTAEHLLSGLKEMEKNLESSHLADPSLLQTLQSAKWVPTTHLLLFTGDALSLKRVEEMLATLDVPNSSMQKSGYFVYKLQNTAAGALEQALKSLIGNLKASGAGDPKLLKALEGLHYIEGTNSVLITGSPDVIEEVKKLILDYDTPNQGQLAPGYFLYRLQNTTGDLVEEDLERLSNDLKKSGMVDPKLIHVIDTMRYVKETNSILLTGDPRAIEEAKELLAKYDYPRPTAAVPALNHFFLYKPQYLDAARIQKALRDVGENLKQSQLADTSFLSTIASMKYVESTNSLIFTGTEEALQKIQTLLKDIDVASQKTIQHLGKTSFFLYKLQHVSGDQIVGALNKIAMDLKKSGSPDAEFVSALSTMRYIPETNSLMFTGQEESLAKVQKLVEKFDVANACGAQTQSEGGVCCSGPGQFFLYSVQYLPGSELIKLLQDFAENVKAGGLCDPELFSSINSARWVEKTRSLVFTGTQKSLDQVKDLLKSFDTPAALAPEEGGINPIESIENTSFLVYKLQFHKGDEIQGALRQIAKDLMVANAVVNQGLLNAINTIQWIEITNSLLCSGDQETLVRLRELIKSLDIPLKQVFIEMLVIETDLANSLTFGLEWGGKYKYRDKFSGSINNLIPNTSSTTTLDSFSQGLNNINPTGTMPINPSSSGTSTGSTSSIPSPQLIPFTANGFDLGVIGEVIRHKGQTFLTLGSLLNALQTESETSIVMNPKLIAQDSKTASIFIGTNVPFAGSFVSNSSSNTVNTTNIEYRDIGMSLTITPVLGNSDIVTLDISFDQSTVVSGQSNQITTSANGTATIQGITTTKNTMQTTVHVPDDNFLILSGQIQSSRVKSTNGLPCLGGLPLIGAAFSTDITTNADSNIVIFLRPHILNSLEDMKKISAAQEEIFRDQAGSPMLEHNFDEAMELIKTVDDE